MVIDRLENIEKYTLLHPLFEQAIDFLKSHDLHFGNRQDRTERKGLAGQRGADKPKRKENAKLETHKDYIDIQIPLSGTEIMGYTAAQDCLPVDAPYNAEKDITFLKDWRRTILQ